MKCNRLFRTLLAAIALGFFATSASSEELSVATSVPPQHHTNTLMFKWFGEELEKRSGGSLTMKLYPAGQLGAGPVQQCKRAVEWTVVSDDERAKKDAAVATGLKEVFADYTSRGITNAEEIYNTLNN